MSLAFLALLIAFPAAMAYAAASDLLSMTIPNRLCLFLVAMFGVCAALLGLGWNEIGWHVAAGALTLVVCFSFFAAGWMGGGDAKILTASAIWFGFNDSLFAYLIWVFVFGGLLSIIILVMRTQHNLILAYGIPIPETMLHKKKVPYGIAIGAAAFMAYPMSPIVKLALAL